MAPVDYGGVAPVDYGGGAPIYVGALTMQSIKKLGGPASKTTYPPSYVHVIFKMA